MLEQLRQKNPHLPFYSVSDPAFRPYGLVHTEWDTAPFVQAAAEVAMPASGSRYLPSLPEFESLPQTAAVAMQTFGQLPMQAGYCWGYSQTLNALEWHNGNEINIAVTDAVLILATRADVDAQNRLNSAACKAFFLPKGTAVEVYGSTLHYCPCQVSDQGFGMAVFLSAGTNTPLTRPADSPLLWATNKWLIAHEECEALTAKGALPGIFGENFTVAY